jgi:hypothetical protein
MTGDLDTGGNDVVGVSLIYADTDGGGQPVAMYDSDGKKRIDFSTFGVQFSDDAGGSVLSYLDGGVNPDRWTVNAGNGIHMLQGALATETVRNIKVATSPPDNNSATLWLDTNLGEGFGKLKYWNGSAWVG